MYLELLSTAFFDMTAASGSPLDPDVLRKSSFTSRWDHGRAEKWAGLTLVWSVATDKRSSVSRRLAAAGRARKPPPSPDLPSRTETETSLMPTMDIAISFPGQGHIRLESRALFEEPGNETCRQFLERVFQAPEITDVTINSQQKAGACPTPISGSATSSTPFPRSCGGSPAAWTPPARGRRRASCTVAAFQWPSRWRYHGATAPYPRP